MVLSNCHKYCQTQIFCQKEKNAQVLHYATKLILLERSIHTCPLLGLLLTNHLYKQGQKRVGDCAIADYGDFEATGKHEHLATLILMHKYYLNAICKEKCFKFIGFCARDIDKVLKFVAGK